jgi:hypothetical protein
MPEISRNTVVFQQQGVLSSTNITSFYPIYRNLVLNPNSVLSFSTKIGQLPGVITFDYFLLPFEGKEYFLKIDSFSLASHEMNIAPFSGLLESAIKEFKTRSGYVRRGPGIDSDYFASNIENSVFIDKYSVFLRLPTELGIVKSSGGVSSTFTIAKWDDDTESVKATKKSASVTISQLDLTPFDVIRFGDESTCKSFRPTR